MMEAIAMSLAVEEERANTGKEFPRFQYTFWIFHDNRLTMVTFLGAMSGVHCEIGI